MTRPRIVRAVAAAGVAALLVPLLASCSADSTDDASGAAGDAEPAPGVTDTEIVVGTHHPLSGPAAAGYASISAATTAYFAYLNDNGGVNGRTIEYIVKDDGYNPATTQSVVRELVLEDRVFALLNGLGTAPHSAVLDFLDENEVPDLFVASGSPVFNQPDEHPWTFGFNADYTAEAKALATYAQEHFPGKTTCLLAQDDDLGEDFAAGLVTVLGEDGLASEQVYTTSNPDVSAQVAAMKQAGCEVNFLAAINAFSALAVGTAAKLGYQPQWLSSSVGGDYGTVSQYLGENAALLEGFVSANYLPSHFSETDEWTTLFRQINEDYNEGAPFDGNTVYGMSVGYLFAEALAKAGETPTRQGIVDAVTSGDLRGNGVVPLALSATNNGAYQGVQVTVVAGGVQEYVGTPYTAEPGAGEVTPYTGGPVALEDDGIPSS
ncbi:ABC transporter substrate-binding protein [Cellulomonas timonensis]|uniref:ABC transporter substrate-binding protein n=1 Tax=Cellulomonas timonensis TaxID=1689271 RepID=UPI00082F4350|nr:ABC transporter substrate-binding protein [Cellulomonas timonensis]